MAEDFELAEDEELLEGDGEEDDEAVEAEEEAEDEEAYMRLPPRIVPQPFTAPRFPGASYPPPSAARDRELRGVKAALVKTRRGTAVIRMPTPVATARGVRSLGRRSRRAEAALSSHERRLRTFEQTAAKQSYFSAGAVGLQQFRDIAAEVRNRVGNVGIAARFMPGVDYGLSALQTAMVAASVPPSRRSWALWSLPITTVLTAAAREWARPPIAAAAGVAAAKRPADVFINVAIPFVAGGISSLALMPRRRRLYVRL